MRKLAILAGLAIMASASSALACHFDPDTGQCVKVPPTAVTHRASTPAAGYFCHFDPDTGQCVNRPPVK
jgi:nitrite reductase/ring-hydroxylating ferredoxin subunit